MEYESRESKDLGRLTENFHVLLDTRYKLRSLSIGTMVTKCDISNFKDLFDGEFQELAELGKLRNFRQKIAYTIEIAKTNTSQR